MLLYYGVLAAVKLSCCTLLLRASIEKSSDKMRAGGVGLNATYRRKIIGSQRNWTDSTG